MTEKFEGNYSEATEADVIAAGERLVKHGEEIELKTREVLNDLAVLCKGNTLEMGEDFAAFLLAFTLAFARAIAKPGTPDEHVHELHKKFINQGFRTIMDANKPSPAEEMLRALGIDPTKFKIFEVR